MSDQEERLERLEYLRSSKRYYGQKLSEAADLINAAHSNVAALIAEAPQLVEDAYEDPEFRFGDVVGSLDFADERRWQVAQVRFGMSPVFTPINTVLDAWMVYPTGSEREDLPERIGVFMRLSSTENQRRSLECVGGELSQTQESEFN